jgi:hypothetical protein
MSSVAMLERLLGSCGRSKTRRHTEYLGGQALNGRWHPLLLLGQRTVASHGYFVVVNEREAEVSVEGGGRSGFGGREGLQDAGGVFLERVGSVFGHRGGRRVYNCK